MGMLGNSVIVANPPGLEPDDMLLDDVRALGGKVLDTMPVEEAVAHADALYVTRLQKERLPAIIAPHAGRITLDTLANASSPTLPVLHPLPRVDELDEAIDNTPHAAYFEQARCGVPVRMAVIELLLNANPTRTE